MILELFLIFVYFISPTYGGKLGQKYVMIYEGLG
jgi:hypothetical protein